MKASLIRKQKLRLAVTLALLCACASVAAQTVPPGAGRIQIDNLDRLSSSAAEAANVSLNEQLLKIVPPILSKEDPEEKNVGELIAGLRGIYVKHFEFDAEGGYSAADLAPIRAQLNEPGWSRIVDVRTRREGVKTLEVYLATAGSRVDGLVVLSAGPKELTVVNLVGTVDLEKLRRLEGNFGVPDLEIERDETSAPRRSGASASPETKQRTTPRADAAQPRPQR